MDASTSDSDGTWGVKGIPRKNLIPLAGKPLLAYTAEAALASRRLKRIVLSTDDPEIARVGEVLRFGSSFSKAGGTGSRMPRLRFRFCRMWCGDWKARGIIRCDFPVAADQPAAPAEDIDGAIDLLERTGADSVISYADAGERHPARMKWIDEDGRVIDPPFAEQFEGQPRQQLKKMFVRDGSVYLTRRDVLMCENSLKGTGLPRLDHSGRALPEYRQRVRPVPGGTDA